MDAQKKNNFFYYFDIINILYCFEFRIKKVIDLFLKEKSLS